jgi:hypothetical protein
MGLPEPIGPKWIASTARTALERFSIHGRCRHMSLGITDCVSTVFVRERGYFTAAGYGSV